MSLFGNDFSSPWNANSKVVELGGGTQPLFRPNIDIRQVPGVDIVQDLVRALPFRNELDGVFTKFALEHVSWREVPVVIKNIAEALKPGGWAVIIVPNTEAQMHWALRQEEVGPKAAQCLFGDQDYQENSHRAAFSPGYAVRLFREAGFDRISTRPFGELGTDMVIEAMKDTPKEASPATASVWTTAQRKEAYNRFYFDGGRGPVGGYSREGYRDFPCHWTTFRNILERKPESVLEIGCARGYIVKRLQDAGIPAAGIEVSRHCILTRACDPVVEWDITETPWPFKDKEFDLSFSTAVLEHIPKHHVTSVLKEIARVSKRGLHGIDFGDHDDGFDRTHCTLEEKEWWVSQCQTVDPAFDWGVVDKESLEEGPILIPTGGGELKLNLGSNTVMYHHGWVNIDAIDFKEYAGVNGYHFLQADFANAEQIHRLAAPGSVDLLYMSHVCEHFSRSDGARVLAWCHELLKPGGLIRIAVPDMKMLCQYYINNDLGKLDEVNDGCASMPDQAGKLWELLFSGHLTAYDEHSLRGVLGAAGFKDISKRKFRESSSVRFLQETIDQYPDISLFMEARA